MTRQTPPEGFDDDDRPPADVGLKDLLPRILWIVIIAMLVSVAQSLLFAVSVLQVIIMVASKGRPNEELGDFGAMIGAWVAKATRYQSAASDQKPWPWTPMGS